MLDSLLHIALKLKLIAPIKIKQNKLQRKNIKNKRENLYLKKN